MTIEEILQTTDIDTLIGYLKRRKTKAPDTKNNLADWDVEKHEIMTDKEKYPDREVIVKQEEDVFNENTGQRTTIPAKTKTESVNRIAIPLEQDIVNIQTAFTVGTEPKLNCDPANDEEKDLLKAITSVLSKNKIKYQNKKIVRAWLAEQEVVEYWFAIKDDSFWTKLWATIKGSLGRKSKPQKKLKSVIWSPFRGDTLYPFFDDYGDLIAVSREYIRTTLEGREITCFQTVTKDMVYQWENLDGWVAVSEKTFKHGFSKLPAIYGYRSEPYCRKIKTLRVRIEKLLSNYADCIDYHFFPILKLFGDVGGVMGKTKDRMVQLQGEGADASYLVWQQAPDTVKLELDTMFTNAYSMTNTPRISFETMQGVGNLSGVAFRLLFMGAHMAVENHTEDIGNFFQRRINFLSSALSDINPYEFSTASKTIDIDSEVVPYTIDSLVEKVDTAIKAKEGGVWSQRTAVLFAGNADRIEEELEQIKKDAEESVGQEGAA